MLRVGILLAGCGAHDGSDIHETVLAALALERALMRIVYLAPERAQSDVVDHAAGAVDDAAATRHLLVESARLARGRVEPLGAESVSDLAAIVVPGGLGVLKNLFVDVLVPGRRARVRDDVAGTLETFRGRGGVLAGTGVAHALLSSLGGELGFEPFAAPAAKAWVDPARRLAWAPGFLTAHGLDDAARGVDELVRALGGLVIPIRRTE